MNFQETTPTPAKMNTQQPDSPAKSDTRPAGLPGLRNLSNRQMWLLATVCLATIIMRLQDWLLPNVGTMVALTLLAGTALRHPLGMLLPLAVRLVTDVLVYFNTGYSFFPSWPFDYTAYLVIFALGLLVPATAPKADTAGSWFKQVAAVVLATSGGVLTYFLLSNFGVWYVWPDTYPHTVAGLLDCFALALPFAERTIYGNLIAAPVFYAAWYAVVVWERQPVLSTQTSEDRVTI